MTPKSRMPTVLCVLGGCCSWQCVQWADTWSASGQPINYPRWSLLWRDKHCAEHFAVLISPAAMCIGCMVLFMAVCAALLSLFFFTLVLFFHSFSPLSATMQLLALAAAVGSGVTGFRKCVCPSHGLLSKASGAPVGHHSHIPVPCIASSKRAVSCVRIGPKRKAASSIDLY
jgi:hypothetical protein